GMVVKARTFQGDDLLVDGTLIADGTVGAPIVFTSDRDDSAKGDTNNDGATGGNNGDWGGLTFNAGSTGNVLDDVEARFAGAGRPALVVVNSAGLTLTNSLIRNSNTAGVRITSSNPTLTGLTVQGSFGAAVSMDLASNPTISGVTLTNNGVNGLALDA